MLQQICQQRPPSKFCWLALSQEFIALFAHFTCLPSGIDKDSSNFNNANNFWLEFLFIIVWKIGQKFGTWTASDLRRVKLQHSKNEGGQCKHTVTRTSSVPIRICSQLQAKCSFNTFMLLYLSSKSTMFREFHPRWRKYDALVLDLHIWSLEGDCTTFRICS